jgi:hypothetical protein
MIFASTTGMSLQPRMPAVPYSEILKRWAEAEFEPNACREALLRLIEQREIHPSLFDPDAILHGGLAATERLLFGSYGPDRAWSWALWRGAERVAGMALEPEEVDSVVDLLRIEAAAGDVEALSAGCADLADEDLIAALVALCGPPGAERWPSIDAPGIYRREHASLLIRSATTSLLLDPQGLNLGWTTNASRYPGERALGPIDAVLITHQHNDHWHLPSICRWAQRAEVPVIVPDGKANLLAPEDLVGSLRLAGQEVVPAAWHTTLRVGDIDIDVWPFYGEQPVRSGDSLGALRNWGNCYRFTCPEFSVAVLVDSGVDPSGDMLEVLARSRAERGPLDLLLSCCLAFPVAINPGLPHYVLAMPFERLRRIAVERSQGRHESMTFGEQGVADACRVVEARHFLPYAHGFRGIGRDPRDEAEGSEAEVLEEVRRRVALGGGATSVRPWTPGAIARVRGGALTIE